MKIGLISFHSFHQPGGVKRHVLGLYKEFKKRGTYCKIIAPRRKRKEHYGKDVILLGTSFSLPFSGAQSDFAINFNPLAIEETLKKEKFDILHFHNAGFPSTFQILSSPSASDTLNILTFHANTKGSKFLKRFPILLKILERFAQWNIDGIIGVAPFDLDPFKRYLGPKIVIPNGVDLREFNPHRPKIGKFLDDKINILFLGRIEERKGLIYLLKAYKILMKKFLNLRLIIGGDGPLRNDLENWVKVNKLKNVIFEGQISEEKVHLYYSTCDIYCSPAIYGESFGIVLVEAMASGKPVVAFANEGYRLVLTGKGARFLAKPRDYKTLAEKLEILIKDENLRKEMGEWGAEEAKKYSWPKVASQVLDFYQFCRKNKQKKESKNLSFEKILSKIYKKNILSWLKLK